MRVALDYLFLGDRLGGIERHAVELPRELLALGEELELTVVVSEAALPESEFEWAGAVRWLRLPVANHGARMALAQVAGLPARGLLRRWDVIHSIANVGVPRTPGAHTAVTVHDMTWHHAGEDWGTSEAVASMRRSAVRAARWASRIQADSESTRSDLVRIAGVSSSKVDVVPLGVRIDPSAPRTPIPELRSRLDLGAGPVVLSVAQKLRFKNLTAMVRLAGSLPADARVVLPGTPTPHEQELRALAVELDVADRVRFPGWMSSAALEGLYGLADCVVIPSRNEGFGLPVLEAMARGVPVACSDRSSLPEVAGDAALMFDPDDQAGLEAAVLRMLGDVGLRRDLAARGQRRAKAFTWRRTAELTLASYRRTVGR